MNRLLLAIVLSCILLMVAAFVFFCAFHYMDRKEDLPERIFFIALGVLTVFMIVIVFVGIMVVR